MTAESPLVSVIVPVYNARRYLDACVQSLRAQTEQNIEILLVDDGSTDGSGELCDRLAAGDGRIVVCHQANGGVSAARNKGLELARGKYIMFCDSDDAVLPRYCQAHLEAMAQPEVALTVALDCPLPPTAEGNLSSTGKYYPDYCHLASLFRDQWFWYCWGKCYEGERIRQNNLRFPMEIAHGEDTVFVIRYIMTIADQPGGICLWREHLYDYFDTPGGLSQNVKALTASQEYKLGAIRELGQLVGFDPREMEELIDSNRLGVLNETLRDWLRRFRWYQLGAGLRNARQVVRQPFFRELLRLEQKLSMFSRWYRWVLNTQSPWLIYLYFHLWEAKNRVCRLCPSGTSSRRKRRIA